MFLDIKRHLDGGLPCCADKRSTMFDVCMDYVGVVGAILCMWACLILN